MTWLQWSTTGPVALLPVLFALTERLYERAAARRGAALALAVALAVFASYPQRVVCGLRSWRSGPLYRCRGAERLAGFLARWIGGVALGLLLSAVQLLPFLEYARASAVFAYREQWMPHFPLPLRAAGRRPDGGP